MNKKEKKGWQSPTYLRWPSIGPRKNAARKVEPGKGRRGEKVLCEKNASGVGEGGEITRGGGNEDAF